MTAPHPGPSSSGQPDETLALIVVITGVLVLPASEPLHVVWLIVVGAAGLVALMRRSAREHSDGDTPPTGT